MPLKGDALDEYREEYNKMLLERAMGANAYTQEKYITISVNTKNVEAARSYFARVGAALIAHFGRLGSKCVEMETDERLRIFHDFYRAGEETSFRFDMKVRVAQVFPGPVVGRQFAVAAVAVADVVARVVARESQVGGQPSHIPLCNSGTN